MLPAERRGGRGHRTRRIALHALTVPRADLAGPYAKRHAVFDRDPNGPGRLIRAPFLRKPDPNL